MRIPRSSFSCGLNGLVLPSPGAENACRTELVSAKMTESGPAAASRPFFEAIDNNDAVGGGRESFGHGKGSRRNFASPAIDWNPMACHMC